MFAIYLSILAAATAGPVAPVGKPTEAISPSVASQTLPRGQRPEGPNQPPTPRGFLPDAVWQFHLPKGASVDLRDGSQFEFVLTVSRWGRVMDCQPAGSGEPAVIVRAACNQLSADAYFWPATDGAGNDIAGTFRHSVKWRASAPPMLTIAPVQGPVGKTDAFPRAPIAKQYSWARPLEADWPAGALEAKRGGSTIVSFTVDRDGLPGPCTIDETSGFSDLDAQSCAIVRSRARFLPALGIDGEPTVGKVRQTIIWRTPVAPFRSQSIRPPASVSVRPAQTFPAWLSRSGKRRMEFDIAPDGTVYGCKETGDASLAQIGAIMKLMCLQAKKRGFQTGVKGAAPNPQSVELEVRVKAKPAAK